MDENGFIRFLQNKQTPPEKIKAYLAIAEQFAGAVPSPARATQADVLAFSALLMRTRMNTFDSYLAIARYGQFSGNNDVYVFAIELLDGGEVLDNLHTRLGQAIGAERRDAVFEGITLPPFGTPPAERPPITRSVMERLERLVPAEIYRPLLADCLRTLGAPDPAERARFLECQDIDEFLQKKGDRFIALLERFKQENQSYYTQEITDDVIAFVESQPEIRQGVRVGNIIYETKIPYRTKEYLAETSKPMKQYHYCHCPWVKESLRTRSVEVSPTFCLCSAGYTKKYWEGVFGQPLRAEVVETVLGGALWCKFAVHLPEHDTGSRQL